MSDYEPLRVFIGGEMDCSLARVALGVNSVTVKGQVYNQSWMHDMGCAHGTPHFAWEELTSKQAIKCANLFERLPDEEIRIVYP